MVFPSGENSGPFSEMSGVLVRLTGEQPALRMAKRSKYSLPPKSCSYTIAPPSGAQVAPNWRSSETVSCSGHPLLALTFHRFMRPVKLVLKTISFPSGDHAGDVTRRL